jgi:hypothetical protein
MESFERLVFTIIIDYVLYHIIIKKLNFCFVALFFLFRCAWRNRGRYLFFWKILQKWLDTGNIKIILTKNKNLVWVFQKILESTDSARRFNTTKINNRLIRLDRIVRRSAGISARRALKRMNNVSVRTVRNYLTRLG